VLQRYVGETGIRAQDARISAQYERFIVAQRATPQLYPRGV